MTNSRSKAKPAPRTSAPSKPTAFYRIDALLHTMRSIEAHEEKLCSLMHEIKTAETLSVEVADELRDVLDSMPSVHYLEDLEALKQALDSAKASPAQKRGAKS